MSTRSKQQAVTPTPRKKKNKVAPLSAAKSPVAAIPPATQEEDEDLSCTSSTKSRPGLDGFIQKAFAELIESNGGIQGFKKGRGVCALAHLLNNEGQEVDPDTFGEPGAPIRTRFRKYENRWQAYYKAGTYSEKVLSRWGIVSFANRQKSKRTQSKASSKKSKRSSGSSSSSSSSSGSISSKEESPPKKIKVVPEQTAAKPKRRLAKTGSPPKVIHAKQAQPKIKEEIRSPVAAAKMSNDQSRPSPSNIHRGKVLPAGTTRISVNINCPEANGRFLVFPVTNLQGVKVEERYEGFSIHCPADSRWIVDNDKEDMYTAQVWGDDAILVRSPAFPFLYLREREKLVKNNSVSSEVNDAIDHCRHEFANDIANRMWSHTLLIFPPGVTLSSSLIFDDAGEEEELDFELVEFEVKYPGSTSMLDGKEMWAHFSVARTDVRASKRGKVEDKKKKKSKAALKLEQLVACRSLSVMRLTSASSFASASSDSLTGEAAPMEEDTNVMETLQGLQEGLIDDIQGGTALLNQVRGNDGKRELTDVSGYAIVFSADDLGGVLRHLPELDREHADTLDPEAVLPWLHEYLNTLLNGMPTLQQINIRTAPTNEEKFAKLLEYGGLKASKNKRLKR